MKTVDLKTQARQVKWISEHTLTDSQYKNILAKKLARAEKYVTERKRVFLKTAK